MNVPRSTRYARLRGRPTNRIKSANQQYLTDHEEIVLWDFIVAKENDMGGKRIRNEEMRVIAQHIRSQRHSDETLRKDSCHDMACPNKNWASAFVNRQVARGVGSRGDKSAVNNTQEIDPWLPEISERLRLTKVLEENIFHLVAVGGGYALRRRSRKIGHS